MKPALASKAFLTIGQQMGWMGVNEIATRLLKILLSVALIRLLAIEDYGEFALGLAKGAMLVSIIDVGTSIAAGKILGAGSAESRDKYLELFRLKFSLGIIATGILIIICWTTGYISLVDVLLVVAVLSHDLYGFFLIFIRSRLDFKTEVIHKISFTSLVVLVTIASVLLGADLYVISLVYLITSLSYLSVLKVAMARRYDLDFSFGVGFRSVFLNLKILFPMWLMTISCSIMVTFDFLVAERVLLESDLGKYAAYMRIFWLAQMPIAVLCGVFYPRFSRVAQSKQLLSAELHFSILISLASCFFVLMALFFFGEFFIIYIVKLDMLKNSEMALLAVGLMFCYVYPILISFFQISLSYYHLVILAVVLGISYVTCFLTVLGDQDEIKDMVLSFTVSNLAITIILILIYIFHRISEYKNERQLEKV